MKIREIVNAYPFLHELTKRELPHKTAFDLLDIVLAVEPIMSMFISERDKVTEKYAVESNGKKTIPSNKISEYANAMESLVSVDRELRYTPVRISQSMIEGKTFTAAELLGARPFIIYEGGK